MELDALIVGGGISGTYLALKLYEEGFNNFVLVENANRLGGFVRYIEYVNAYRFFTKNLDANDIKEIFSEAMERFQDRIFLNSTAIKILPNGEVFVVSEKEGFIKFKTKSIFIATGSRCANRWELKIFGSESFGVFDFYAAAEFLLRGVKLGEKVAIYGSTNAAKILLLLLNNILPKYVYLIDDNEIDISGVGDLGYKLGVYERHIVKSVYGPRRLKNIFVVDLADSSKKRLDADILILAKKFLPNLSLLELSDMILYPRMNLERFKIFLVGDAYIPRDYVDDILKDVDLLFIRWEKWISHLS